MGASARSGNCACRIMDCACCSSRCGYVWRGALHDNLRPLCGTIHTCFHSKAAPTLHLPAGFRGSHLCSELERRKKARAACRQVNGVASFGMVSKIRPELRFWSRMLFGNNV